MNQVPALIKDLENTDPTIRLDAIDTFAQIGFIAVQSLQRISEQIDHRIASQSLPALSKLTDDAIQLLLAPIAQSRSNVYSQTTEAFQDIVDIVLMALSYSLHDDHWKVRHRAMEALWQMGTPEAISALDDWDNAAQNQR
jgi:HEAT repeat protein